MFLAAAISLIASLPLIQAEFPFELNADTDPLTLSELADRYCIGPDGDHRLTWHLAEQDGFVWLTADQFPNLRLLSGAGNNLRGLEKTIDGVQIRVLTSAYAMTVPDDGKSYFRQCWVTASPYDAGDAERGLNALLGVRRFRADNTLVYAWIPQVDGSRRSVSRRIYMRRNMTLSNEQGLRQATLKSYQGGTFIGYRSPRDRETYRLFDWAGPEPVSAPE